MNGDAAAFAGQDVIANVGDNVTLDCNLAAAGIIIKYPVYWMKGEEYIGVKQQNLAPFIYPSPANQRYSVIQRVHSGALVISLMISTVEQYDVGEYKCYDSDQSQQPRVLFQSYNVSVVKCLCAIPKGIANVTGDTGVTVYCSLHGYHEEGYQTSLDGDTSVNISLGSKMIKGNVQDNYLVTHVKANRFCHDVFLRLYTDSSDPSSGMQCKLRRLNPCPFNERLTETTPVTGRTTSSKMQTSKTQDTGKTYNKSSPLPITPPTTTHYRTTSSKSPSSQFKETIWISAIAVVIFIAMVVISTICIKTRRKTRQPVSETCQARKSGWKKRQEDTLHFERSLNMTEDSYAAHYYSSVPDQIYEPRKSSVFSEAQNKGHGEKSKRDIDLIDEDAYLVPGDSVASAARTMHAHGEAEAYDMDDGGYLVPFFMEHSEINLPSENDDENHEYIMVPALGEY